MSTRGVSDPENHIYYIPTIYTHIELFVGVVPVGQVLLGQVLNGHEQMDGSHQDA